MATRPAKGRTTTWQDGGDAQPRAGVPEGVGELVGNAKCTVQGSRRGPRQGNQVGVGQADGGCTRATEGETARGGPHKIPEDAHWEAESKVR
eukprot:5279393-Pyramimonas_sp.AAC.1